MTTCPNDGEALIPESAALDRGALEPGMMVGEYRVDAKLGSGTFGDVYSGEQPLIGKKVAIKVLSRRFSSEPQMVSRFVAEARAVNRVRHRNIIDIFSFGTLPGRRHYFVMELLSGEVLSRLLEHEGRLSPAAALPILKGVAEALAAAHKAGIAHRDLKPDNVFIAEEDGRAFPKLLDFGMAKLLGEPTATHKTATGAPIGTPSYMSPEQCRGAEVDHRADIYAFGVLTHRALTGSLPFNARVTMDLMVQHTSEPPPAMSSVCADLPRELDTPVLAMLAKDPAARPATMADAFNALQIAMETAGVVPASALIATGQSGVGKGRDGVTIAEEAPAPSSDPIRDADARASGPGPERTPSTLQAVNSSRRMQPPAPPRRTMKALIGATALAAAAAVSALALSTGRPVMAVEKDGASVIAAAQRAFVDEAQASGRSGGAEQGASVKIRVLSSPPDAEIWKDERLIGRSGEAIAVPRGKDSITIELRKEGYQPKRFNIVPDDDMTVPLDLEPAAPEGARAAGRAPRTSAAPATSSLPSPAPKAAAPEASPEKSAAPARPAPGQAPRLGEVDTPDEFRSP